MRFSIDPVVTDELVSTMADQMEQSGNRETVTRQMEKLFAGDRSREDYEGLLAGYANAFSVVDQSPTGRTGAELGPIVAFVASKVEALRAASPQ